MKHARPDYDRIQDPAGLIPDDEPVFIIRAQDIAGPATVQCWAAIAKSHGAEPNILEAADDMTAQMRNWQRGHVCKVPDMPSRQEPSDA